MLTLIVDKILFKADIFMIENYVLTDSALHCAGQIILPSNRTIPSSLLHQVTIPTLRQ